MKTQLFPYLILAFLLSGCSDKDGLLPSEPTFIGSTWISILDTDESPVQNVLVEIGTQSAFTNEDGQILFRDIALTKSSYLTAKKNGYFHGSRRFFASEGRVSNVEIRLMPKEEAGSFQSASIATINVDAKSSITFQGNSIVYASGEAYSGNVHVEAYPIHADDPNLSQKMPGNLLSLDDDENLVVLQSYGMIAVELKADNGSDLQLAGGKTAEIRMDVPQYMLSTAPASIPLWYFDEVTGYWIEDGQATLQGNEYVGEVRHFTIWNYDYPEESYLWEGSFQFENGEPAASIEICLTHLNTKTQSCGLTDEAGYINSAVPRIGAIQIDAIAPCRKVISSHQSGPFTSNIKEPVTTITKVESDYVTVTGTILSCDNVQVQKGHLRITSGSRTTLHPVAGTGPFSFTYLACANENISVRFVDEINGKMSAHFNYHSQSHIDLGTMVACDELDVFISYNVEGVTKKYVYISPECLVNYYPDHTSVQVHSWSTNRDDHFSLAFQGTTTGSYPNAASLSRVILPDSSVGYISDFFLEITEFGEVGDMIRGTFTGKVSVPNGGPSNLQLQGAFGVFRPE